MIFKELTEIEKAKLHTAFEELLRLCDKEFVPPLSSRASTTQSELRPAQEHRGIEAYCAAMLEQEVLCALDGDKLLGFVSYRKDHTCDEISDDQFPNIYISTLIVSPCARGQGLTKQMYEIIFKKHSDRKIFTRTWSKNHAHIAILKKFGFREHIRKKNDRGDGIDTVYFTLR
jgi:ribosomal protein S18 acetylase RimI-like enzyme